MNAPADSLGVAIVCDYSLGYLGGAQTALLQEASALADAGVRVLLLSPSTDETWQRVRPSSAAVHHVQIPSRCTLPGLDLPVVRNARRLRLRVAELLLAHRCQVVHLQSEFGLAAAAVTVAAQLRIPVVHTVHTFFWQAPPRGQRLLAFGVRRFHQLITGLPPTTARLSDRPGDSALRNMTLTIARRATLVLSPSAHQADRLRHAGLGRTGPGQIGPGHGGSGQFGPGQVAVLPNTVAAVPEATELTAVDGPLKIVWIGRCVPEKRILIFVRAAVAALDQLGATKIDFTVIGAGPQLSQARSIAGSRPGISFLGRQDHDRVTDALADSHLAALTSYGFDNQPMTIVEAVMALRGVIYCDPALQEGLDGPGILAPSDAAGLAATLVELAQDPDRVIAASRAAAAVRVTFSPEHHAAELIMHYRHVRTATGGQGTD